MSTTTNTRNDIRDALRLIAAQDPDHAATVNGVGFSKFDGEFGHKLAETPAEQWSPRMTHAAWRLARKYRVQLGGLGIDFDSIPEPVQPAPREMQKSESTEARERRVSAKATGTITIQGDEAEVAFQGFFPALVQQVKSLPGRRWNGATKTWTLPANGATLPVLLQMADENGMAVIGGTEKVVEAQTTIAASRATDADVDLGRFGVYENLQPFPFQRGGIAYALKQRRTWIADQMGLGKTIQGMGAVEASEAFPALFIVPASLRRNWQREMGKWMPHRSVQIVQGTRQVNIVADIVVMGYDVLAAKSPCEKCGGAKVDAFQQKCKGCKGKGFVVGVRADIAAVPWKAVIYDEAHYLKGEGSQRSKAARALTKVLDPDALILLLTGTPIVNRPAELVPQLQVIGRLDDFGGWKRFVERYCGASKGRYGWDLSGAQNLNELQERLRSTCYIRRTKADVITDLPDKVRSQVTMQGPADRQRAYDEAEADVIDFLGRRAADIAKSLGAEDHEVAWAEIEARLRAERAEHLVRITTLKRLAARAKVPAVIEWVRDFVDSSPDDKMVVFAHHRDVLDELRAELSKVVGHEVPTIMGGMSDRAKDEAVQAFQNDPSVRLILVGIQAGGVGFTLTKAYTVLFVELAWTPAAHDQAEDRVYARLNDMHGAQCYYSMLDGNAVIDEDSWDLIAAKRVVVDAASDGTNDPLSGDSILGGLIARLAKRGLSA